MSQITAQLTLRGTLKMVNVWNWSKHWKGGVTPRPHVLKPKFSCFNPIYHLTKCWVVSVWCYSQNVVPGSTPQYPGQVGSGLRGAFGVCRGWSLGWIRDFCGHAHTVHGNMHTNWDSKQGLLFKTKCQIFMKFSRIFGRVSGIHQKRLVVVCAHKCVKLT